jgi:hypothetical protein
LALLINDYYLFSKMITTKIKQISVLMLFVGIISLSGCSVFGKSGGKKNCGCPSHRGMVG